ncbi:hypothetical protein PUR28_27870 [Streptomyces sp. BE308]|uniref:hypothetical protein n=1 Tax=Streptomyces sp. BE308 TaxID=3002529 RepID=UPI002E798160|nr:hypothetical protein [Streptomyces sp. BE308]MEE1794546.1 hypothetical protein [Streptomyces sp. BE308]
MPAPISHTANAGDYPLRPELTTDPNPLQAGVESTLHITVRPQPSTQATCGPVHVTVPVGDGPGALTLYPNDIHVSEISPGWTGGATVQGTDTWTFTVEPTRGETATITSDAPLEFKLRGVRVSETIGTSTVALDATPGMQQQPFSLPRMPKGFVFRGLVPEAQLIDSGKATTLHWDINQAAQVDLHVIGVDEQAHPYDHPFRIEHTPDVRSFTTDKLYGNTFFQLTASVTEGSTVAEHTLTTYVAVAKPAVETGLLIVSGTARVLGTPQLIAGGPAFFTGGTKTYTTTTDGIICARLQIASDPSQKTGTIQFTTNDGAGITGRLIKVQSHPIGKTGTSSAYTEFTLKAGTCFSVERPHDDDTRITDVDIRWIPLGTGPLTQA